MRNLALAPDASFHATFDWNAGDLPISLPWRSTRWRYVVPSLWIFGCFAWISLAKMETPGNIAVVPYALLFIGLPASVKRLQSASRSASDSVSNCHSRLSSRTTKLPFTRPRTSCITHQAAAIASSAGKPMNNRA